MTTTQHAQAPMRMPRTVSQALMFLEQHGHSPIMTPDGILVVERNLIKATADNKDGIAGFDYGIVPAFMDSVKEFQFGNDTQVDHMFVWPVVGNVVDLAPIREWQGY